MEYENLLKIALTHIPEMPIKPTSTWIAILLHSKSTLSQIKEKNDFLWIKCHERITVRTLKHEYFSRHPLEDFELKFLGFFPANMVQVKHLRQRTPIKNQVIVLRAIEEPDFSDLTDTTYLEDCEPHTRAGDDRNCAIVITDDDEANRSTGANSHVNTHQTVDNMAEDYEPSLVTDEEASQSSEDIEPPDMPVESILVGSSKITKDESVDQRQSYSPTSPFQEDEHYTNAGSNIMDIDENGAAELPTGISLDEMQGMDQDIVGYRSSNFEEQTEHTSYGYEISNNYPDLFTRIAEAALDPVEWQVCEHCGKQMHEKLWTISGAHGLPLCYCCCLKSLKGSENKDALRELHCSAQDEYAEKYVRHFARHIPQNFDHDAPYDHPSLLRNVHTGEYVICPVKRPDFAEDGHAKLANTEQCARSPDMGQNGKGITHVNPTDLSISANDDTGRLTTMRPSQYTTPQSFLHLNKNYDPVGLMQKQERTPPKDDDSISSSPPRVVQGHASNAFFENGINVHLSENGNHKTTMSEVDEDSMNEDDVDSLLNLPPEDDPTDEDYKPDEE